MSRSILGKTPPLAVPRVSPIYIGQVAGNSKIRGKGVLKK